MRHVIGRDRETAMAADMLLHGATVVSLVGMAGVGTSTVARQVTDRLTAHGWACGAEVHLGDLTTPGEAVATVCHAVAAARRTPEQRVVVLLEGADEHRPAALAVTEWAYAHPDVSLVLPTLAPLRIPGGHTVAVHPWRTTPDDDPATSPGVELFVETATACDPDLRVEADDLGTVARIVHLTGGLPLAIQIAARRASARPLAEIETALGRFDAPRPAIATLDWCSSLLTPPTRQALWAVAIFTEQFTLEAAAAVANCQPDRMAEHVAALQAHGLVEPVDRGEGPLRFRLPRLVRAHASGRLLSDPALLHTTTGRLVEHVARLAADSARAVGDRDETYSADAGLLVLRHDLVPLLDWTGEQRPARAATLVSDLVPLALRHGDEWELGPRLVELVGTEVSDPDAHPEVLLRAAHLALRSSFADQHAIVWLTEGVDRARARGEDHLLLRGLALWMDALATTGDPERTTAAVTEGLEVARRLGLARWEARFEAWTAMLHHHRQEHDLAYAHGTKALESGRRCKDLRAILVAGMALRATPRAEREVPGGLPRLQQLWEMAGELRDVRDSTALQAAMAVTALSAGNLLESADRLERQTKTIVRTGLWDLLAQALYAGVMISAHRDDGRTTARWHGALAPAFDSLLMVLPASANAWYQQSVAQVREAQDPEQWDADVRAGALVPWPELANELLDLAGRVQREERSGMTDQQVPAARTARARTRAQRSGVAETA